jgi:hypothetical protein
VTESDWDFVREAIQPDHAEGECCHHVGCAPCDDRQALAALDRLEQENERLRRIVELATRWLEARRTYPERASAYPGLVASGDFMREDKRLEAALHQALEEKP